MFIRVLAIIAAAIVVLLVIAWLGFRIPAISYVVIESSTPPDSLPLPTGLPEPVMRHIRATFGESMPRVESAIAYGRATISINGLTMPVRFRIYYDAQRGYYHDMQATWFTLPILSVNERYLDGAAIVDIPIIGHTENDAKTDSAANQGFWSEVLAWVPAIPFADPRVQWEAIDAHSARMLVPGAAREEAFTIQFDPDTGLMTTLTTMRYQGKESTERTHWENRILAWETIGGVQIPVRSTTQWGDAAPWASWETEDVVLNVDVTERMERFGG